MKSNESRKKKRENKKIGGWVGWIRNCHSNMIWVGLSWAVTIFVPVVVSILILPYLWRHRLPMFPLSQKDYDRLLHFDCLKATSPHRPTSHNPPGQTDKQWGHTGKHIRKWGRILPLTARVWWVAPVVLNRIRRAKYVSTFNRKKYGTQKKGVRCGHTVINLIQMGSNGTHKNKKLL